jgi:hypothetical protein
VSDAHHDYTLDALLSTYILVSVHDIGKVVLGLVTALGFMLFMCSILGGLALALVLVYVFFNCGLGICVNSWTSVLVFGHQIVVGCGFKTHETAPSFFLTFWLGLCSTMLASLALSCWLCASALEA